MNVRNEECLYLGDKGVDIVIAIGNGEGPLRIGSGSTSEDVTELVEVGVDLLEGIGNGGLFDDNLEIVMGILEDNGTTKDQIIVFNGPRRSLTRRGVDMVPNYFRHYY